MNDLSMPDGIDEMIRKQEELKKYPSQQTATTDIIKHKNNFFIVVNLHCFLEHHLFLELLLHQKKSKLQSEPTT